MIAVIGLLAAFLLPVLARTKERARTFYCRNNLHQIGLGLGQYLDDFQKFPLNDTISYVPWDTKIFPYAGKSRDVFRCPVLHTNSAWSGTVTDPKTQPQYNSSFGINGVGTSNGNLSESLGLAQVPTLPECAVLVPSQMIEIADLVIYDDGDIAGNLTETDDWIANRHREGGNVVFGDAHVEWATQKDWMKPAEATRSKWNRDHFPHPETWH